MPPHSNTLSIDRDEHNRQAIPSIEFLNGENTTNEIAQEAAKLDVSIQTKQEKDQLQQEVKLFADVKNKATHAIQSIRSQSLDLLRGGKARRLEKKLMEWEESVDAETDIYRLEKTYDDGLLAIKRRLNDRTSKQFTDNRQRLIQIFNYHTSHFQSVYNSALTGRTSPASSSGSRDTSDISKQQRILPGLEGYQDGSNAGSNVEPPSDVKDAFEKRGIVGALDELGKNSAMTPGQRKFWQGAATLGLYTAGAVLAYKAITGSLKLFTGKDAKEKASGAAWLLGSIVAIGGPQWASGGSLLDIVNGGPFAKKLAEWIGSGTDRVANSVPSGNESHTALVEYHGFPKISTLFAGMKYEQIAQCIKKDDQGKIQIDYEKATAFFDTHTSIDMREERKNILISLKDDRFNLVHFALNGMGLSYDDLIKPENAQKEFSQDTMDHLQRLQALEQFMKQRSYMRITPQGEQEVRSFLRSGKPSLKDLEKNQHLYFIKIHQDNADKNFQWDGIDVAGVTHSVQALSISEEEKNNLIRAGNRFYKNRLVQDQNAYIDFTQYNTTYIALETYEEKTPIDLKNMTIPDFIRKDGHPVYFDSYTELLKIANVINFLKHHFAGKAKKEDPFDVTMFGRDISFTDSTRDTWAWKEYFTPDTEVLRVGWFGKLAEISLNLEEYKSDFVHYLNTLKKDGGGSIRKGPDQPPANSDQPSDDPD